MTRFSILEYLYITWPPGPICYEILPMRGTCLKILFRFSIHVSLQLKGFVKI